MADLALVSGTAAREEGSPMDNIQNLVDSVDAVLRSPREQAEMEADAQKLLHDFIAELKVTLGLDRKHEFGKDDIQASDVLAEVRRRVRSLDYQGPLRRAVRYNLVMQIEEAISEIDPDRLG
jgi:DNA-directed RNA polymerase specialized sigma54-like protein